MERLNITRGNDADRQSPRKSKLQNGARTLGERLGGRIPGLNVLPGKKG